MNEEDKDLFRYGLEFKDDSWFFKELEDNRTPKLTLRHLNKMKKIKAVKRFEVLKRQDLLKVMYGAPPNEEGGGPGGL